jgi:Nucleotidyl transferase AbiEii toxin, Type IV TA system
MGSNHHHRRHRAGQGTQSTDVVVDSVPDDQRPHSVSLWLGFTVGPILGILFAALSALALVAWSQLWPASFDEWVTARMRSTLPVVAEAEACAEKLARYRRVALARDLYDLNHFATRSFDEPLVRRLWVLKVWADVIDDRRGNRPLRPEDVLTVRSQQDFEPDSIGVLTRPVDIPDWEARVRRRFAFLTDLDADEQRWASCSERHRSEVQDALSALRG